MGQNNEWTDGKGYGWIDGCTDMLSDRGTDGKMDGQKDWESVEPVEPVEPVQTSWPGQVSVNSCYMCILFLSRCETWRKQR